MSEATEGEGLPGEGWAECKNCGGQRAGIGSFVVVCRDCAASAVHVRDLDSENAQLRTCLHELAEQVKQARASARMASEHAAEVQQDWEREIDRADEAESENARVHASVNELSAQIERVREYLTEAGTFAGPLRGLLQRQEDADEDEEGELVTPWPWSMRDRQNVSELVNRAMCALYVLRKDSTDQTKPTEAGGSDTNDTCSDTNDTFGVRAGVIRGGGVEG